ncbi:hypothetical protein Hypma_001106 [Hypsizygus marmoreus]|uniref:Uncharacterized protein n=1 Tax=Hypsizygus marmoreus TaxID=39966 RepID=A0A369JDW6_HYPMA|nr:hypothetical protein Hypma_001106 [Hypsizygus marmoreus]
MVMKSAGWQLTYKQARQWLKSHSLDPEDMDEPELPDAVGKMLTGIGIPNTTVDPIPVDYPRRGDVAIIILCRISKEDMRSTVPYYTKIREEDADREVKKRILEHSGFKDEDLPWVTAVDPFQASGWRRQETGDA